MKGSDLGKLKSAQLKDQAKLASLQQELSSSDKSKKGSLQSAISALQSSIADRSTQMDIANHDSKKKSDKAEGKRTDRVDNEKASLNKGLVDQKLNSNAGLAGSQGGFKHLDSLDFDSNPYPEGVKGQFSYAGEQADGSKTEASSKADEKASDGKVAGAKERKK